MNINEALEIYFKCHPYRTNNCEYCQINHVVYPDKTDHDFDINICGCFADIETTLFQVKTEDGA